MLAPAASDGSQLESIYMWLVVHLDTEHIAEIRGVYDDRDGWSDMAS